MYNSNRDHLKIQVQDPKIQVHWDQLFSGSCMTDLRKLLWDPVRAEPSFPILNKIRSIHQQRQSSAFLSRAQHGVKLWQQVSVIKKQCEYRKWITDSKLCRKTLTCTSGEEASLRLWLSLFSATELNIGGGFLQSVPTGWQKQSMRWHYTLEALWTSSLLWGRPPEQPMTEEVRKKEFSCRRNVMH